MTRRVTVTLTQQQARALLDAVGNSIDSEEDALAVLLHPSRVSACYRGYHALLGALRESMGRGPHPGLVWPPSR